LREALRTFFNPLQLRPVRYHRQEAEEITILLNWLYARRDVVSIVRWEVQLSVQEFAAQVRAAIHARPADYRTTTKCFPATSDSVSTINT
jgi:hypothetical protein